MTGVACVCFFFSGQKGRPGEEFRCYWSYMEKWKNHGKITRVTDTHTRTRLFLIINQKDMCVYMYIHVIRPRQCSTGYQQLQFSTTYDSSLMTVCNLVFLPRPWCSWLCWIDAGCQSEGSKRGEEILFGRMSIDPRKVTWNPKVGGL